MLAGTRFAASRAMDAEQRAYLRANLVRVTDIAERAGVRLPVIATWRSRYAGFPDPLLPHDKRSTGAVYWWPDVEKFLRDNELPDARYMRGKSGDR